jgi:hypothetical protein
MTRPIFRLAIGLAVSLALVACAPEQESASSEPGASAGAGADDATCEAYDAAAASFEDFRALDPATASIDDYRTAAGEVRDAWSEFVTMRRSDAADTEYALRATLSDLSTSLLGLPDGTTPQEAVDQVQPQIDAVQSAFDSIGPEVGCGPGD